MISGCGVGVNKIEAFLIVELSDISNLKIKENILYYYSSTLKVNNIPLSLAN